MESLTRLSNGRVEIVHTPQLGELVACEHAPLAREDHCTVHLRILKRFQVLAIDRALQQIKDSGEIRIVIHRGHLRFLERLNTDPYPSKH